MKVITVPKDKAAEKLLDYDNAQAEELIELELLPSDFRYLFEIGYWNLINNVSGSLIDEFEDESISDRVQLKELIGVLEAKDFSSDPRISKLNMQICSLVKEAYSRKTSIHFFF